MVSLLVYRSVRLSVVQQQIIAQTLWRKYCKVTKWEKKKDLSSKIASLFKTRVAITPFPL